MNALINPILVTLVTVALALAPEGPPGEVQRKDPSDVTVTLKEIDLDQAIREFQKFQQELDVLREEVSQGQKTAREIAGIIGDLRQTAGPENQYNEAPILEALSTYVENVMGRKVELVDFLESQRYRIAYYATKMAASVQPEDVALLFGTSEQGEAAIRRKAEAVTRVEADIRTLIDQLVESNQFSLDTFQPLPAISRENRQRLAELEFRYQNEKNALELTKSRLRLLEQSSVGGVGGSGQEELNVDLLLTQMFGALDRIRLQMNSDLLHLENFLSLYERSTRAHNVLQAFEQLIAMQGGIEGPNQGLASILDWLQESSQRQLTIGLDELPSDRARFPRSPDLLREAYIKASDTSSSRPDLK